MKRLMPLMLFVCSCGAREKLTEALCPAPAAPAAEAPASQPSDPAAERFLALRSRRLALEARELAVQEKEKAISEQERIAAIKPPKPISVDPLPGIFASMESKAAAHMLTAMTERDAADLLQHAETERASEILSVLGNLDVQRAARIAKQISRRHQEVEHVRTR